MVILCSVLHAVVMVTLTTAFLTDDTVLPIQDSQYLNDSRNNLEYTWSPAKLKKLQNLLIPMKNGIGAFYEYLVYENKCHRKFEQYRQLLLKINSKAFDLVYYLSETTRSNPKKIFRILLRMEEGIEKLIDILTEEFGVFDSSMKKFLATTVELKKILED